MKTAIAIIAVLLVAGCDVPTPGPDTAGDASYASAAWSWSFATRGGQSPAPSPVPVGDKCENCRGTGKLGDGTVGVTCPVCNGTGKRINQPAVQPDEQGDDVSFTEPTPVPAPPREECEVVPAGEAYTPSVRRGLFGRWRRW